MQNVTWHLFPYYDMKNLSYTIEMYIWNQAGKNNSIICVVAIIGVDLNLRNIPGVLYKRG